MTVPANNVQDMEALLRANARVEIRDVRIFKSLFEFTGFPEGNLRSSTRIDTNYNFDEGDDHFLVVSNYKIEIDDETGEIERTADLEAAEESKRGNVATIEFDLVGLFTIDEHKDPVGLSAESINQYSQTTGKLALHPYARSYVQDVTVRMGLPPLTLGVFRIGTDRSGTPD